LDSGRIRADDLTTIYLVLEAAGEQITEDSYAIIFNQVPSKVLKRMNRDEFYTNLCDSLRSKKCPTTKHVHFNEFMEDMDGEDDMLCDLDEATSSFIASCPTIAIDDTLVKDVNADAFDEITAQNESLLNELQASQAAAAAAQREKELADARAMEALEAEKSAQREKELADARAMEALEAEKKAEEAAKSAQREKAKADEVAKSAQREKAKADARAAQLLEEKKAAAARARQERLHPTFDGTITHDDGYVKNKPLKIKISNGTATLDFVYDYDATGAKSVPYHATFTDVQMSGGQFKMTNGEYYRLWKGTSNDNFSSISGNWYNRRGEAVGSFYVRRVGG